jgi:hypothetical protein
MLGLGDFWVSSAFLLCILSSLLCIIYGAMNWNKGDEPSKQEIEEEKKWDEEEKKIEENL